MLAFRKRHAVQSAGFLRDGVNISTHQYTSRLSFRIVLAIRKLHARVVFQSYKKRVRVCDGLHFLTIIELSRKRVVIVRVFVS